MKLPKIYGFLKQDLERIESELHESILAEHPVLREASVDLLEAGGKRIRPVFVLLSGQTGTYDADSTIRVAVALELIHMATLVHDDVIDEASVRRGKPTTKAKYGNLVAMYTGDYMLARALQEVTKISNPPLHRQLSRTLVDVSIGEIKQIEDKFNWDQNLRSYLRRIKRKTALLIASSCKLGALVNGHEERAANKLYQYGYYIGMSYQIIDDILDFTSSEKQLGKPAGNDLLQGNITLPVLYAMEDEQFKTSLKSLLEKPADVKPEQMQQLIKRLKKTDAINRSYLVSDQYLQKALRALNEVPESNAKRTLQDIAKYIGKRRK